MKMKTKYQNLQGTMKNILQGKLINTYTKNLKTTQINNVMMHLRSLDKQEQAIQIQDQQKEIAKIRTEVN